MITEIFWRNFWRRTKLQLKRHIHSTSNEGIWQKNLNSTNGVKIATLDPVHGIWKILWSTIFIWSAIIRLFS